MKQNQRFIKEFDCNLFSSKTRRNGLMKTIGLALVASMFTMNSCSPDYELGEKDPDWLGNSIYEYLSGDGNFKNTVRLIDDLNYKNVLAKTGSKTLFVADDDAFERFFKKNDWGVTCYEDLTTAQKKLLLYGSMINNACQVAYLSSSSGPIEGDCMRRETSASIFDSVPLLTPEEMPLTPYWQYYRDNNKTIPCFCDGSGTPMIHFIEAFLTNKLISNDDCNFLFNYESDRQPGDANVNGVKMIKQNIKCSNGFIHQMKEVTVPLDNMATIIDKKPNTSKYAKLLNRFCAPYYGGESATIEYNRIFKTDYDSVFTKRYFSLRSMDGTKLEETPAKGPVNGTLKFDPGWSSYYSEGNAGTSMNVALQENMGVMLVPSDQALDRYWNEGAGKVLKDYYGSWENVPDKVISKMINVNMLNSFVNSVPSKFNTVLNDANDELGLSTECVDSVWLGCNGAIYLTNKVFNPTAYVSVSFPALINDNMSIFYWAIEQCGYDVYLNSQQSYYSLFIPKNDACLQYIDPCSYGKPETQIFKFKYNPNALESRDKVKGSIWRYNVETGEVGDSISEANYDQIRNRLEDILNTHIVIGNVEDGNEFYKTKGGTSIRVINAQAGKNGMKVQGTSQIDRNKEIAIVDIYDESYEGNGKTYIIDEEPIMSGSKTVCDVLESTPEFSEFWDLLEGSEYVETKHVIGTQEHGTAGRNISLFNTFQYTVYVPTNAAIKRLHNENKLPTWDDVAAAEEEMDEEKADSLTNEIHMFLKYHIQDNSFFIGAGNVSGKFETFAYDTDNENVSYHKLTTNSDNSQISVTDELGNTRTVTKTPGLYNIMVREFQYDSGDATSATAIYTSSTAVIHQIDDVLYYKKGGNK